MKSRVIFGSVIALIAATSYAFVTTLVKWQGGVVSTPIVVFIQSITTLVLITPFLFHGGIASAKSTLRTQNKGVHLLRSIFSLGISYCLYYATHYMPLVNVVLISNMSPLLIPIISFLLYQQPINHKLWLPILTGLAGLTLVLQPNVNDFQIYSLVALAGAICMGLSSILVKRTTSTDSSLTILFYYFLFSTIISGVLVINYMHVISLHTLYIVLISSVLFFITQLMVVISLKYIDAQIAMSMFYANVIIGSILGHYIWHDQLDFLAISGIVLTVLSGLFIVRTQQKLVHNHNHISTHTALGET